MQDLILQLFKGTIFFPRVARALAMAETYKEIRIHTRVDAGELLAALGDPACLGAWETGGEVHFYWLESTWDPLVLRRLRAALERCGDADAADTASLAGVPDQDWNRLWTESLKPVRIGRRLLIRQSWNRIDVPSGTIELVIDPKRAFGTGYHATTRLIAGWLEDIVGGGERLLDVGTGSGILAMAALRLGAGSALAVDIDPEALSCARENAVVNGFGPELELRLASPADLACERQDLVLANLDLNALLTNRDELRRLLRPGGRLLVSGLLEEDGGEFSDGMTAAGWRIRECRRQDGWLAMELVEGGPGCSG